MRRERIQENDFYLENDMSSSGSQSHGYLS